MNCNCAGEGYYYDRRCVEKVCAHPHAAYGEPMECPKRPCTCKAGLPFRQALQKQVQEQDERIRAYDAMELASR